MKTELYSFPDFVTAIQNNELVYLFGTGISSALTGKPYSWWKWILDGIHLLKDPTTAAQLESALQNDPSTENMIHVVGQVLDAAKQDGVYHTWMQTSFETNPIQNTALARTLRKLLITQDVFATTNYDLLLEKSTGLTSLSQSEPAEVFSMLDHKVSKSVLHIHGIYDSTRNLDNIIADASQYAGLLENQGAQFIQHILGTRTLIFVGCGKTTEDANIAQFIRFAADHLHMDRPYYFLHNSNQTYEGMPGNIHLIPYGDEYTDLPGFLEDIAQLRIRTKIESNPIVDRTTYSARQNDAYGLADYHFSREHLKFCGRKSELGQLKTFAEGDAPFCWWAITGQGGSGKSRLAYELMHHISQDYFAFFLNANAAPAQLEGFQPFNDTFVVIDYIKGNEANIAHLVTALENKFRDTWYRLRILFLDRDNQLLTGSWYQLMESSLDTSFRSKFRDAEYNRIVSSNSHHFLHLDDLDAAAILELIGSICENHGLPPDSHRDEVLKNSYAQKFEQLRFRPLFLQMYVEAWIDNGCIQVDYRNYEDLLYRVLGKEQERMLAAVEGNIPACNSLIRLMIRAGIQGKLQTNALPPEYRQDWEAVKDHVKVHTFPGIQRKESLLTLLAEAEHGLNADNTVIQPLYPDIIKEAMFLYYVDEEDYVTVGSELWHNCPEAFMTFLSRLLIDFSDNEGIRNYIRSVSADYNNPYALEARFALLQNEVVRTLEEGPLLIKIVHEETAFWQDMPLLPDTPEAVKLLKLKGLHYSAVKLIGWNDPQYKTLLQAIADFEDSTILTNQKINFLLDHAHYFTAYSSCAASEDIVRMLESNIVKLSEGKEKHLLWMRIQREHILNLIEKRAFDAAWTAFEKVKSCTVFTDEHYVQLYADICFSGAKCCFEVLAYNEALYYANDLQDYASSHAEGEPVAFNDSIHHYYLHAKAYQAEAVSHAAMLKGMADYGIHVIRELMDEIEKNVMISEFSGLLVWMWGLLVGSDDSVTDQQVSHYLDRTKQFLEQYPSNEVLASKAIDLWDAIHVYHFKKKVPHRTVLDAHMLLLRFATNVHVQDAFYQLLKDSEDIYDQEQWISYFHHKQLIASLIQNHRSEYAIPPAPPQTPFVNQTPKVGPNDPCPCGSGRKYKKCCRPKGLFR